MTSYDTAGKQAFRELLLAIASRARGQGPAPTFGTLFGYGADSALMSAEGFDVLAVESDQERQELMRLAEASGHLRGFYGNANRLRERRWMFHADFDGGPSPANFRTVTHLASITDHWLAVTLSMDHLRDESMMGEAAFYTIPAWLTGASGFTLEYLTRYKRNRFGQTMWSSVLQRREGKGNSHRVQPLQVERSMNLRGYWASSPMYRTQLMPHYDQPVTPRDTEYQREKRHVRLRVFRVVCSECEGEFTLNRILKPGRRPKFCSETCRSVGRRRAHDRYYSANRDLIIQKSRDARRAKLRPTKVCCGICRTVFVRPVGSRGVAKYCSNPCARAAHTLANGVSRRKRAAVSGTATEAIYDAAKQEKAA